MDRSHNSQPAQAVHIPNARDASAVEDASTRRAECKHEQQSFIEVTTSDVYMEDLVAVAGQRELADDPLNVNLHLDVDHTAGQSTTSPRGKQSCSSESVALEVNGDGLGSGGADACTPVCAGTNCIQVAHSAPTTAATAPSKGLAEVTSSSLEETSYETATDYESWRALYIMKRLEEAVRKRGDILLHTPADLQPKGSAKTKTAFVCQPPWTVPIVTELSQAVQTRWKTYCAEHPEEAHKTSLNRGSSTGFDPVTPGTSTPVDSRATSSTSAPAGDDTSTPSTSSAHAAASASSVTPKKRKRKRAKKLAVEMRTDPGSDAESSGDEDEPVDKRCRRDDTILSDPDIELDTAPTSHHQLKEREKRKRQRRNRKYRTHSKRAFEEVSAPPSLSRKIFEHTDSTTAPHLVGTDLHTNPGVYTGPPSVSKSKVEHLQDFHWSETENLDDWPESVKALLQQGFKILHNDKTRAQVITDAKGVILAVKALAPKTKLWEFLTDSVDEQLAVLHESLSDDATERENRTDGAFKHVTVGVSMGKGQKVPMHLGIRNEEHDAVRAFIEHPDVRIFADQMSKLFRFWFPKLFELYWELEKDLEAYDPRLRGCFPGFPMHAETPNTGKKVRTPLHVDEKNALFGMCIIAIFGKFNHEKHGMLILRELKIVMQLAPGDIVFIPSALITHGNTELAEHDTRRSWTTFTAGALFRFRDAGFTTERDLVRQRRFKELRHFKRIQAAILEHRMGMHLTLEELQAVYRVHAAQ